MKIRRTHDPDICFMASDPVTLWTTGIVEYRVDRRDKKFLVTPVMRDRSEGPVLNLSDKYQEFLREQRQCLRSDDTPVSYDPILLKKIAQIYTEADDAFLLAVESAVELAARERRSIEEEPRFLALVNEFGRDAVLVALYDVQQIRLETFEKVFGKVRRKPSPSDQ